MKSTVIALSLLALASSAPAALVTGWVTTNGDAGFVGGSEATGSPVTTDATGDTIAANFPAVTLADGDSLILTGSVSFNSILTGNQFRIGLFDGDDPVTTGDGLGYVGIYAQAGTTAGGPVNSANGTATNPFSGGAATVIGTMTNPANAAPSGSTIAFNLTIVRDGANLDVAASYDNGGAYNSTVSINSTAAVPASFTYNSVAFLMGGSLNATQANYTNVDVTSVPEPSISLLGALGALALIRRRRA